MEERFRIYPQYWNKERWEEGVCVQYKQDHASEVVGQRHWNKLCFLIQQHHVGDVKH